LQRAGARLLRHHCGGGRSSGGTCASRRAISREANDGCRRHHKPEVLTRESDGAMTSFYPWLILLAPFASATVITLFTLRWKSLSSAISITAVLVSFCCSCLIFAQSPTAAPEFVWLDLPPIFRVPLGLTLDQLSRTMALVVSGVG